MTYQNLKKIENQEENKQTSNIHTGTNAHHCPNSQ